MIITQPSGIVDLAAYRAAKQAESAKVIPPTRDKHEEHIKVLIYKAAARKAEAKVLADNSLVESFEAAQLLHSSLLLKQEAQRFVFAHGLVLSDGLDSLVDLGTELVLSARKDFIGAYPEHQNTAREDFADELAYYTYRRNTLLLDLKDESNIRNIDSANRLGAIEAIAALARLGHVHVSITSLHELLNGQFEILPDEYARMDRYYAHYDFEHMRRNFEAATQFLSKPEIVILANAYADGFQGLMDSQDGLQGYFKDIERQIGKLQETASINKLDVSTIKYDAQDRYVIQKGYVEHEGQYIDVDSTSFFMSRYNIDEFAARRLIDRISTELKANELTEWQESNFFKVRHLLAEKTSALTGNWQVIRQGDTEITDHVIEANNGVSYIKVKMERTTYDNWDGPYKVVVFTNTERRAIDRRFHDSNNICLAINEYNPELHDDQIFHLIAKFVEEQSTGLDWAKLAAFEPPKVDEHGMSYPQLVKADLQAAVEAGVLPLDLKFTTKQAGYKTVGVTISGLPEGMTVYTKEYVDMGAGGWASLPNHDEPRLQGAVYTRAYEDLLKAVDSIARSRIRCIVDDPYGDYGSQYNFHLEVGLKKSLEESMQASAIAQIEADAYVIPAHRFNIPESASVLGQNFPAGKRLTIGPVKEAASMIDHIYRDISSMRSDEIGSDVRVASLIQAQALLNEVKARLPLNLETDSGKEMVEILESCTRRLGERFDYCAKVRLQNDAIEMVGGEIQSDGSINFETEEGFEHNLKFKIDSHCPTTGRVVGAHCVVSTKIQNPSGESVYTPVTEFDVNPYRLPTHLDRALGFLNREGFKEALGLFSAGAIHEYLLQGLVETGDFKGMVRDTVISKKVLNGSNLDRAFMRYLDIAEREGQLTPAQTILAKATVLQADGDEPPLLYVVPKTGFMVQIKPGHMMTYLGGRFDPQCTGLNAEKLLMECKKVGGVIYANEAVTQMMRESDAIQFIPTPEQVNWISNQHFFKNDNWDMKAYRLASTNLGGNIIHKQFDGYELITPEGESVRLDKAQQERIAALLSSDGVEMKRDEFRLNGPSQGLSM